MKVALLTFHDTTNFGSLLQTYGLYRALQDLQLPCEILNYQCAAICRKELPAVGPERWTPKKIGKYLLVERVKAKKYRNLKEDAAELFTLSRLYTRDTVGEAQKDYDVFLVGSDILWGLDITEGDTAYFLDFVRDPAKKYAFATSVGNPWTEAEKQQVRPLLQSFHKIAVREQEAAVWVQELTGTRPPVVCDPTMLLDRQTWDALARQSNLYNRLQGKKYVLTYFDTEDGRMHREACAYAKSHNLEVFAINYGIPRPHVKNVKPVRVREFLALVRHASAVFTASYHGMMFAIYFEKILYYYNDHHASRFDTVANRLGLMEQKRAPETTFVEHDVDYSSVTRKVSRWRDESRRILKSYWEEPHVQNL